MDYFFYGICILLAGAVCSLLLPERFKGYFIFAASCFSAVLILIPALDVLFSGNAITAFYKVPGAAGEVRLVIDRLSAFFLAVISIMSSISTLYAAGYMKHYNNKNMTVASHFFFLPVLIISMLLVAVIQNAVAFLIVWEIMSLSSFFLLIFENEKEEVFRAGINYLISMHIGVIFLLIAFIILILNSGNFDFNSFREVFEKKPGLVNFLFILFFAGFGTKAGFVPFHTWLPQAHPAAPSHISGLMSGVMIKTGIYGILRIINIIPEPTLMMAYFILFISLLSGIVGIAYASAQSNLKKLLAYSSVENIGIIGLGIGAGLFGIIYNIPALSVLAFSGSFLHLLNHSVFKSMLFYSAGGVYHAVHFLEMEKLGGLIKSIKWTAVFFLIGAVAISGLPPLNGFISEFYIYWGLISGIQASSIPLAVTLIAAFAGLSFIGAMALLCFTKAFGIVFLGSPRSVLHETPHDLSLPMKIAMIIQSVFIIAIGLAPAIAFKIVSLVGAEFSGQTPVTYDAVNIAGILNQLSMGLLIFIGIAAVIFIIRSILLRGKVSLYKTWDCGYQSGNTRMQYTASSYSEPFVNLIRPLFHLMEHLKKPEGVFPVDSSYKSHIEDKLEFLIINPVMRFMDRFLNLFKWIQSGNTQQYILYGLIFLIAVSVWIIWV